MKYPVKFSKRHLAQIDKRVLKIAKGFYKACPKIGGVGVLKKCSKLVTEKKVPFEDICALVILASLHPEFSVVDLIKACRTEYKTPIGEPYLQASKALLLPPMLLPSAKATAEERQKAVEVAALHVYRSEAKGALLFLYVVQSRAKSASNIKTRCETEVWHRAQSFRGRTGRDLTEAEMLHVVTGGDPTYDHLSALSAFKEK